MSLDQRDEVRAVQDNLEKIDLLAGRTKAQAVALMAAYTELHSTLSDTYEKAEVVARRGALAQELKAILGL